ncbi:MAG: AMP-binding protein [Prevotella sp.]|uniref:AMP-binding protein n=2 Tax=Pseudomonadati TaxID=3379134 RepID=UPI000B9797E6|nr:AMP-binding protein [Prevotella sp. P5-92]MCI6839762.1 AMP-binding protein [Prevotella sp.]MCI7400810.1 AMP-binding protein [Prevotella sp.]MDY4653703.1 AMP-binding protein [Prevotella sp.]OYP54350.1 long-chain fatty acid--CoA ligase [Prevotella sp. P5-92]
MNTFRSFNSYIERSIIDNWNLDALTDYKGITLQYHDVARKIEKLHILFEYSGVKPGDKIGLCGRNSSHWAVAFFATLTYGAVAVPIQNEFKPEQIYNIVNHSESKLLFVGDYVAKEINPAEMPSLEGIINIPDYSLMLSRTDDLTYAREHLNEIFGRRFPRCFRADDVHYHEDQAEELAVINYTSGTTGFSKGVMLPYRALWGNLDGLLDTMGTHIKNGSSILSILPMAHMYGMLVEFIFPFVHGCHLFFLTRLPSPAIIAQAFAEVHPSIVISVPLVVDKIIRKHVFPRIQNNKVRLLWNMPVINKKVKERICQLVMEVFGGNAYQVMTGGAALNQEIEQFLKSIDFPITSGYGATECAPLITYSDWHQFVPGSCGTPVKHMEVKILSPDPARIPGEIVARGVNVMLGYYKNPEATAEVLDADGWYHTGDLATMSADGHVFIRGRIKNMLLGANGQNVYPEEIEDKLNNMAMVSESLILQRGDKFVALVVPDKEEAQTMNFTTDDIVSVMEQNRKELNLQLPPFCQLSAIEIHEEDFAKTPKKSIKRYLYK